MRKKGRRDPRISTFQWCKAAGTPQIKLEEIVERLEEHAIATKQRQHELDVQDKQDNEPPVNIVIFDGGAMRSTASATMLEEISKRFQDKNVSDYIDLTGGTSAGGAAAMMFKMNKGNDDKILEDFETYSEGASQNKKPKLSLWKLLKSGYATDHVVNFSQDFVGKDTPLYMPTGMKAFVVATRRVDLGKSFSDGSDFEPYIMRTYDNIEPPTQNTNDVDNDDNDELAEDVPLLLPGTSKIKLWEAMAATTAVPVVTNRVELDIEGQKHKFGDGLVVCNSPVAIAIAEARTLWPNRPIGVVVSFGISRGEDELNNRAIEASKMIDPDLHYLRLYPPFKGFSPTEMNEAKHEELRERCRVYINETIATKVDEMLAKLAESKKRETRNSFIEEMRASF